MVTPLHCLEAFTTNNNCASSLSSVVTSSSFCANGLGTLQCRIECSAVSVGRGKFGLNSFHYALLLSGPKVNKNYFSSHQSLEVLLLHSSCDRVFIVKSLIFWQFFHCIAGSNTVHNECWAWKIRTQFVSLCSSSSLWSKSKQTKITFRYTNH